MQEGRAAKVQSLFYNSDLLGNGSDNQNKAAAAAAPTAATSLIKTDVLTSPSTAPSSLGKKLTVQKNIESKNRGCGSSVVSSASVMTVGGPLKSGSGKGDGKRKGSGEKGATSTAAAAASVEGLEDVNWSDDEALDALIEQVGGEVDGQY